VGVTGAEVARWPAGPAGLECHSPSRLAGEPAAPRHAHPPPRSAGTVARTNAAEFDLNVPVTAWGPSHDVAAPAVKRAGRPRHGMFFMITDSRIITDCQGILLPARASQADAVRVAVARRRGGAVPASQHRPCLPRPSRVGGADRVGDGGAAGGGPPAEARHARARRRGGGFPQGGPGRRRGGLLGPLDWRGDLGGGVTRLWRPTTAADSDSEAQASLEANPNP
jgi:hypothetical protein